MNNIFTDSREITIIFKKPNSDPEKHELESKILISTTADSLTDVKKTDKTRIYFFVNESGNESSCYEFDPFNESINFKEPSGKKKNNKYFSFTKTIKALNCSQEIRINENDEEEDELEGVLHDLYEERKK